jgi:hypothetical protein
MCIIFNLISGPRPTRVRKPAQKIIEASSVHQYATTIDGEIVRFLENHTLQQGRAAGGSVTTLRELQRSDPSRYQAVMKRAKLDSKDDGELANFILWKYVKYLRSTTNVTGHMARLEDTVDFVLSSYAQTFGDH